MIVKHVIKTGGDHPEKRIEWSLWMDPYGTLVLRGNDGSVTDCVVGINKYGQLVRYGKVSLDGLEVDGDGQVVEGAP